MAKYLHMDMETRSAIDLTKVGVYNYARDETTDIWCIYYALDDGPIRGWRPGLQPLPEDVREHIAAGGVVVAHNAPFEQTLWNELVCRRYGPAPRIRDEVIEDTMVMALAMGFPAGLERAAQAARLSVNKDAAGRRLMLQMAKPRRIEPDGTIIWWDDPNKLVRLAAYCKNDVRVERELHKRVKPLTEYQKRIQLADLKINRVGIPLDRQLIQAAKLLADQHVEKNDAEMSRLTGGMVQAVSRVGDLRQWLESKKIFTNTVAKDFLQELLRRDNLTPEVRAAAQLRLDAGKTSNAKFAAMLELMGEDDRARGCYTVFGAGTGRFAGRHIQPHNLPRPKFERRIIENHILPLILTQDARAIETLFGPLPDVLSSCIRSMICAPDGKIFVGGDWSNIEGRMLAWQAGEDWKIKLYKDFDAGRCEDPYLVSASKIKHLPPEECGPYRQIGKVAELALGYEGGVGAFQSMAAGYGLEIEDEEAEIVKRAWREAHPAITRYWRTTNLAALNACAERGKSFTTGAKGRQTIFHHDGTHLWAVLPSGRTICYPYAHIGTAITPWGETSNAMTYYGIDSRSQNKSWRKINAYGGMLVENLVQGASFDILAHSLLTLVERGATLPLHIHDELVLEVDEEKAEAVAKVLQKIMQTPPKWAKDLPLVTEPWIGKRFRK